MEDALEEYHWSGPFLLGVGNGHLPQGLRTRGGDDARSWTWTASSTSPNSASLQREALVAASCAGGATETLANSSTVSVGAQLNWRYWFPWQDTADFVRTIRVRAKLKCRSVCKIAMSV